MSTPPLALDADVMAHLRVDSARTLRRLLEDGEVAGLAPPYIGAGIGRRWTPDPAGSPAPPRRG